MPFPSQFSSPGATDRSSATIDHDWPVLEVHINEIIWHNTPLCVTLTYTF